MTPNISDNYSEELIRLTVEASPNGMVLVDRTGTIVLLNASIESLFGYRRRELIGQQIEILVPKRFRSQHPGLRTNYLLQPETRAMGQGRDLFGLHKNGSEIPVEIGLNPIQLGEQTYILASVVDITQRQRSQEMIRLAVEAAPNGMIMTDAEGSITLVNSQLESLFGYSREELVGANIDILVPERFRVNHPDLRRNYCQSPVSRAMGKGRDLFALHKNGSEFPVEIGLNPLQTDQGLMILASVVDITERKRNEEKLKANLKEKEVLLSEIHHRVKNNLQIIDSLIGIQTDRVSGEAAIAALMDSQNRVRSIAKIHQVLYESHDFSRVEMADVLAGLLVNLNQSFNVDQERILIHTVCDPVSLPIDKSIPLGLIINELVTNAFKHGFPKHKQGEIRVILKPANDHTVQLIIEDSGVGIPEDYDIELSDSLGLHLVATLVDQLEAKMEINRANPTRFTLLIPLQEQKDQGL